MDNKLEQIIIGGVLGDFSIRANSYRNKASIRGGHKLENEDYLKWKVKFFENFLYSINYRKNQPFSTFESRLYKEFFQFYKMFYKNRKKTINENILNKLSYFGILIWYLDDGGFNYRANSALLCTDCFKFDEVKLIKEFFSNLLKEDIGIFKQYGHEFGDNSIKTGRIGYRINFKKEGTKKLLDGFKIFKNDIPISMRSKFGNLFIENIDRIKESREKERCRYQDYDLNRRDIEKRREGRRRYYQKHKEEISLKEKLKRCKKKGDLNRAKEIEGELLLINKKGEENGNRNQGTLYSGMPSREN